MKNTNYIELLHSWQISFAGLDETVQVAGSPERAAQRVVVRDVDGVRWILERIEAGNLNRKQDVAEHLEMLSGMKQVHPYRPTTAGFFFAEGWMLRSYIEGIELDRKTYLQDAWRINAMADFLLRLRDEADTGTGPVFSMCAYAQQRMDIWRGRYSKLADKLEHSFQTLEKSFFQIHDQLPVSFCHGDYHPLNMVWGTNSIRSVIDWEFCGIKPELYDMALLVGCIGFEDPDNLIKEPVIRLVQRLRAAGYGSEESWAHFLELTATIRFGWMSEWIRRRDREARQMEAVYIDILVDQKDYILEAMNM
jgi:homoserine kinase type II